LRGAAFFAFTWIPAPEHLARKLKRAEVFLSGRKLRAGNRYFALRQKPERQVFAPASAVTAVTMDIR
jgi:hypothetical protein